MWEVRIGTRSSLDVAATCKPVTTPGAGCHWTEECTLGIFQQQKGLWWCPCGCPWVTPLGRLSWPARGQCQWSPHVRSLTPVSRHHRAACPRAHSPSPFSPPWGTLLGVRHNNTPRPAPPRLLGASSCQHQTNCSSQRQPSSARGPRDSTGGDKYTKQARNPPG